jgi:hypothetical protein
MKQSCLIIIGFAFLCCVGCKQHAKIRLIEGHVVNLCPIHRDTMKNDSVPIAYGLPAPPIVDSSEVKPNDAFLTTFPYANFDCQGGCVVSPTSPHKREVEFCPVCRAVAIANCQWMIEHNPRGKKLNYYKANLLFYLHRGVN